jgi:hypothetical protein
MTSLLLGIPLLLFVLIVAAVLLVMRRTSRVVAETRGLDTFRQASGRPRRQDRVQPDRRQRADRRGSPWPGRAGQHRRHAGRGPRCAQDDTGTRRSSRRARRIRAAARAARGGARARGSRVEMIDHGCGVLSAASVGRAREAEGQIAIKRGYLNILHARETIVEIGTNVRSPRPSPTSPRWFSGRPGR